MNVEQIERLTMDRLNGELNEDTASLLQAYLTEHPEWVETIGRIEAAHRTVAEIYRQKQETSQVMPDFARLSRRPFRGAPILMQAALILLAVGIGTFIGRQFAPGGSSTEPSSSLPVTSSVALQPADDAGDLYPQDDGFWRDYARHSLETKPSEANLLGQHRGFWSWPE